MKCGPRREGREPVVQPDTFQVQPFFSDSDFFLSTIFLTLKSKSRRTEIQNNNQMSFDSPSPSIRSIRSIRIQHRMSVLQVFIPFATFAHHHHTCHLQITLITDPLPEERPSSSSNFRAWPTNMMKMWKMNFERCWINWEQSRMTRLKSIQHTAKKFQKKLSHYRYRFEKSDKSRE